MSAIVTLMPTTKVIDQVYDQPPESIVDVSGYTEAAVCMRVFDLDLAGDSTYVHFQTSVDNLEGHYFSIATKPFLALPDFPEHIYFYLNGPSSFGSATTGFGKYLRLKIFQGSSAFITLEVKALLKP